MTETPWFPGHITFSKWRGVWCSTRASADDAAEANHPSAWQGLEWRGLTEQPK